MVWKVVPPRSVYMIPVVSDVVNPMRKICEEMFEKSPKIGVTGLDVRCHLNGLGFNSLSEFRRFVSVPVGGCLTHDPLKDDLILDIIKIKGTTTIITSFRDTTTYVGVKQIYRFIFLLRHLYSTSPVFICYVVKVNKTQYIIFYLDVGGHEFYRMDLLLYEIHLFRFGINNLLLSINYNIIVDQVGIFSRHSIFVYSGLMPHREDLYFYYKLGQLKG